MLCNLNDFMGGLSMFDSIDANKLDLPVAFLERLENVVNQSTPEGRRTMRWLLEDAQPVVRRLLLEVEVGIFVFLVMKVLVTEYENAVRDGEKSDE